MPTGVARSSAAAAKRWNSSPTGRSPAASTAPTQAAGLRPVGELFHRFAAAADERAAPVGITGVVLLAESHLAVHTWPELDAVTLDVYVCNAGVDNSARARALLAALIEVFAPAGVERHELRRGALVEGRALVLTGEGPSSRP